MKIDVYTKMVITIIAIALLDTIFILAAPSPFGQTPFASHLPAIEGEGFLPVAYALKGKWMPPVARTVVTRKCFGNKAATSIWLG